MVEMEDYNISMKTLNLKVCENEYPCGKFLEKADVAAAY